MTISVTWPNIYKLAALIAAILTLMVSLGSFIVQRQIDHINQRLDDRLTIYQSTLIELQRRLERLEHK